MGASEWILLSGLGLGLAACESDSANPASDTAADATVPTGANDTSATTTPEIRPDAAVPDTVPPTCGPIELSGELVAEDVPGAYTIGGSEDLGFGDERPDAFVLEFWKNQTGTFDLATGENDNYGTCDQCVRVVQDIDASGAAPKYFFQAKGKLTVDPSTPPEEGRIKVRIEGLELVEVKIFADYHSEAVKNGACYSRATPLDLETATCVPVCGERVCGPDGCGGECGAGCGAGKHCSLDGSTCTAAGICQTLTLRGGALDNLTAGVYRLDTTRFELGAVAEKDFLQLEFYSRTVGAFDLIEPPNDNYGTCKQCVRMVLDGKRDFFQADGSLVVATGSDPIGDPDAKPPQGALSARLMGIRLVEVALDEAYNSTPLPGGACVDLTVEEPLERTLPP